MVARQDEDAAVSGRMLSTVVPATVTGGDRCHKLTDVDLAMKLHYLRGLYFFSSDAVEGLTISDFKKPMFQWLDLYHTVSGRVRRSENGRPVVKCNDGGVRIVEAHSRRTLEEWLAVDKHSLQQQLVYSQALGPDLSFSPLVYLQFTWLKCGGLSVGLSWAHVLGDAFSASQFMNTWGQILSGYPLPQSLSMPIRAESNSPPALPEKLLSLKRTEPVGDLWVTANSCKMETHSFHITSKQLRHLQSTTCKIQPFEAISAIIWKSLAKIRKEWEPRIVTICRKNSQRKENEFPSNGQMIGTVETDFSVAESDLAELGTLIAEKTRDEERAIEGGTVVESARSDFVMYGSNLTFVNLEEAEIYGLEVKGHRPVFANYTLAGVGEEGVVLVSPRPENGEKGGGGGRTVTVILPEEELGELKNELNMECGIV